MLDERDGPMPDAGIERDGGRCPNHVGLVGYDENKDVFPVTGWDAIVFVVGGRRPQAALQAFDHIVGNVEPTRTGQARQPLRSAPGASWQS